MELKRCIVARKIITKLGGGTGENEEIREFNKNNFLDYDYKDEVLATFVNHYIIDEIINGRSLLKERSLRESEVEVIIYQLKEFEGNEEMEKPIIFFTELLKFMKENPEYYIVYREY